MLRKPGIALIIADRMAAKREGKAPKAEPSDAADEGEDPKEEESEASSERASMETLIDAIQDGDAKAALSALHAILDLRDADRESDGGEEKDDGGYGKE